MIQSTKSTAGYAELMPASIEERAIVIVFVGDPKEQGDSAGFLQRSCVVPLVDNCLGSQPSAIPSSGQIASAQVHCQ
jgi:hypothetical protein